MRWSSERLGRSLDSRELREDLELQILLVEDNPDDAALICHTFAHAEPIHFEIDTARDLESATRCVERCQYDAMLLDLGLPDSSGALTFQWACPQTTSCPVDCLERERRSAPDRDCGQLWHLRLLDQGLHQPQFAAGNHHRSDREPRAPIWALTRRPPLGRVSSFHRALPNWAG